MRYNFASATGVPADVFHSALTSFRSDTEQYHSPLSIHNDESKDILLARQLADEMVNVSGAEIKLYVRTDNADYDSVWDEDADPTYWNPIPIKAFFKPEPLHTELSEWGVDTPNRTEVIFSHRQIIEQLGDRMIRPGDVLQLPYNSASLKPKNYVVLNATPTGNFRYIWLYMSCDVETLTADSTVRVQDDLPPENIVDQNPVYRESL